MALYESLTAQSTPDQIAAAYQEFTGMSGGDTTANQDAARSYLTNLGIAAPTIEQSYNQFLQPAQIANTAGMGAQGIGLNFSGQSLAPDYTALASTGSTAGATQTADQGASGVKSLLTKNLDNTNNLATTNNAANNVLSGVILAGDSWLSNPTTEAGFEAQLGQNVTNVAFGGARSGDVLNQLDSFLDAGGTFAPGSTVMLNLGGNDLLEGRDPATVRNNLNQLVSELDGLGVNVILSGASDVGSVEDVTGSTNLAMSSIYNDVANSNSNVTLVDAMSGLLNQKNLVTGDGFHLNDAGRTAFNATLSNAYLNSQGKSPIEYTDQAIRDFVAASGLTPEQASVLAPSFGLTKDRVLDALSPNVSEEISKNFGAEAKASAYFDQNPDVAAAYAKDSMGMSPQEFAERHYEKYGATEGRADLDTAGILSGFKYANDAGVSEDRLKRTLGEDVFNTYKTGFADYAKTGLASILADNKLSFDEARTAVKFGRDYGYDAQKLADLTGTDKRVFDAIYKNYDDTTNRIVDSVLDAEDVKTNDDKVVKAFQLQKQFGFTDEDLAKAADFTPEQVKGFLDPVRNYESERQTLFGNTDTTSAEARKFIEDAKKNGAVSKLYNEDLGNLDTKIAELEDRWKTFEGVDPLHAQRVYDQIGQQRTALGDKYYQGTFGDPMKMAATLAKKGIDTLADIGQKDKFETEKAEVRYTTADGMPIQEIGDKFYVAEEFGDGGTQYREVPKDQIKTTYGRNEFVQDGELGYSQFVPLTAEEQATLKDGKYEKLLGKVAYDKDTGKEIAGLDGTIEAEKSGKWYNKKRNELNVGFTDSGVPVLYTTKEKTGFGAALEQALPVIAMALPFMLPGIGAALSSGLASAGGSALAAGSLANSALTQGIISGTLGSLGGQDFGKSFLSGAINPVINTGIGSLLPTGMDPNIARAVTGAGSGVIKGALQGGDIGDLLQQGILSGATNYGLGEVTKGLNLTPQQLNFATGIALPLIQGQKVNPMNVIGTLAQSGQQAQKARP